MKEEVHAPSFHDASSATAVGRFRYNPASQSWWWSDGMYRIHGFAPGEVVPSTELVFSHIHPEDAESARAAQRAALETGEPFTFPHRLLAADGEERIVIAVGHAEHDAGERAIVGHLVDVTEFRKDALGAEVDQAVQDFKAHREVIEQAKGVLMQLYSVDAVTAWQLLRAYSQSHNRKVRDVSAALASAASQDETPGKHQRGVVNEVIDRLIDGEHG